MKWVLAAGAIGWLAVTVPESNAASTPLCDDAFDASTPPSAASFANRGYDAVRLKDWGQAIRLFTCALEAKPALDKEGQARVAADAGFLLNRIGRPRTAATFFRLSYALVPKAVIARAEGYARKAAHQPVQAAQAFRRALTLERAQPAPDSDRIIRLRREVRTLERFYSAQAHLFLRSDSLAGTTLAGTTLITSQATVQARLFLERWLATDARLRARLITPLQDGGLLPDVRGVQGGVGFRWRPFKRRNIVVGVERLVAIGAFARDDWLVQADWSYGTGYQQPPGYTVWPFYSLLSQSAVIGFDDPQWLASLEAQAGVGWQAAERLTVRPIIFAANLTQKSLNGVLSLTEAGPGVRLIYRRRGAPDRAGRTRFALDLRLRIKVSGSSGNRSGFSLTLSTAF